uniref:Uncharacterized protein n=1 Tax=Arundo donax TaxID=35708 RepID=A0A0A8XZP4_ARUDO
MDATGDWQHPPPRHQPIDLQRTAQTLSEARPPHDALAGPGAHAGCFIAGGRAGSHEDARHLVRRQAHERHTPPALLQRRRHRVQGLWRAVAPSP